MANLDRGIVTWTGPPVVGGGVTVMYATPGGSFMAAIRTFFSSVAGWIPNGVTLTFPSSGDTIDDATGHLVGTWSGTGLTPVTGGASTAFAAPAGVALTWLTSTVVPGSPGKPPHRVHGRTFLVPLTGTIFDTDGTLTTAGLTSLNTNANTLITSGAGHFQVWHRPTTPGGTDGASAPVLGVKISDKAAVLTSRRD